MLHQSDFIYLFIFCAFLQQTDAFSTYNNRLIYQGPQNPGPIMRDPTFDIPVKCSQNNRVLVSLALAPKPVNVNKTLEGQDKIANVTYTFQVGTCLCCMCNFDVF